MAYKKYSDAQIGEALVLLAINKYDFAQTSEILNIPAGTLRRWDRDIPKKGVADLLDRAIERLLIQIPSDWKGKDWAAGLGILMDKWLLVQGKATNRSENIFGWLQEIPEDELDELIREIEDAAKHAGDTEGRKGQA